MSTIPGTTGTNSAILQREAARVGASLTCPSSCCWVAESIKPVTVVDLGGRQAQIQRGSGSTP